MFILPCFHLLDFFAIVWLVGAIVVFDGWVLIFFYVLAFEMPFSHDSADSKCCYNVAFFILTIVICKYEYNIYLKIVVKNY